MASPESVQKVHEAFQMLDKDGTGKVSESHFKTVLNAVGCCTESDASFLLGQSQCSDKGMVNYAAFLSWLFGSGQNSIIQKIIGRITYGQAPLKLPKGMKDLDMGEKPADSVKRKCKIICTMGPSCWDVDKLVTLIDCGMNICRLNFSHGDHEGHGSCVKRIREAAAQRPDKPVAILLDTKGPEIRTGFFAAGGKIELTAGQDLKLVTDYSFKGDNTCFAVTYEKMPQAVKPGNTILMADGSLVLKVKSCGTDHVMTTVMNSCSIGERKNCNLPGVKVDLPVLQQKDIDDIQKFGIPQGVDFVAASFVQSAADVKFIREVLGEAGKNIKIISKIENQEGLINFDEICETGDGIMVARGDLGMEIPPEKVFLAQKIMIAKCNSMGKPVVTATQMLESMGEAPRPTRAEAGDVANAVLDGTDCVMLSGETAGGQFPVEAVTVMRKIVEECEASLDYNAIYLKQRLKTVAEGVMSTAETTCSSSVKAALDVDSPAIVVLTKTGAASKFICKYRPAATILMGSTQEQVIRQSNCMRGVRGIKNSAGKTVDERIDEVIAKGKEYGIIRPGSAVIAVHGKDGDSNLLKMIQTDGTSPPVAPSGIQYATIRQGEMILPKDMLHLEMEEKTLDSFNRKCKIICTMGPSCWSVENLVKLIDAGLNIARLNFSHGDHESHAATVGRIREADKLRPDKPIGILLDTKGPEIRTGFFAAGGKINLTAGQDLKLVVDYSFKGDNTCFAVTYERLPQAVKPGNTILMADGSLVLKVKSCGDDHVMCEVMNSCSIGERKNCNLPGVKVDLPVLQQKDIDDLVNFGIPQGVHFVAASFVQTADDVKIIRSTLGEKGKHIKIISKIENQEGLANFDEICEESDGIMIARGDLGMEIPPEKVFIAQKIMTAKCNLLGKPVITATQMLESMCKAPRPTRAEAGDVANAVLDGTDAVMLSGETAGGEFPVEAVTIMRRLVEEAEASLDYQAGYLAVRESVRGHLGVVSTAENMASTAVKSSLDSGAAIIVVITRSGVTARLIAKYRPLAAIIAVTDDEATARFLQTSRGIVAQVAPTDQDAETITLPNAIKYAQRIGVKGMVSGAPVVLLAEEKGRVYVKMVKVP